MKIIFVVDDNATNLTTAEEALEKYYRVIALSSAEQMFKALHKFKPDLIMLDVEMPEMNGFEAMERLKANSSYADIPVIYLTGMSDDVNEARGIELGAVDFISKPFSKPVLLNRIKNHLEIDALIRERTRLFAQQTEQLLERTHQLVKLQSGIICTMADLVENRDKDTGGHIERTSTYMRILIDAMFENGVYAEDMVKWDLDAVISSARLHDVGKITISDTILNKPGKLTDEEFDIMKTHSKEGESIIEKAIKRTGDAELLQHAKLFAAYHHERWNGRGYPYGLSGTDIPLHGRLMAIVDVYDALVSERPYKKAFSHEDAHRIIVEDSGQHFDPLIVEIFTKVNEQIYAAKCTEVN